MKCAIWGRTNGDHRLALWDLVTNLCRFEQEARLGLLTTHFRLFRILIQAYIFQTFEAKKELSKKERAHRTYF